MTDTYRILFNIGFALLRAMMFFIVPRLRNTAVIIVVVKSPRCILLSAVPPVVLAHPKHKQNLTYASRLFQQCKARQALSFNMLNINIRLYLLIKMRLINLDRLFKESKSKLILIHLPVFTRSTRLLVLHVFFLQLFTEEDEDNNS